MMTMVRYLVNKKVPKHHVHTKYSVRQTEGARQGCTLGSQLEMFLSMYTAQRKSTTHWTSCRFTFLGIFLAQPLPVTMLLVTAPRSAAKKHTVKTAAYHRQLHKEKAPHPCEIGTMTTDIVRTAHVLPGWFAGLLDCRSRSSRWRRRI